MNCALFVALQVSPLSATRLASLADSRKSKKEETKLEFSVAVADKQEESQSLEPKNYLMANLPISIQPHVSDPSSCEIGDEACSQRLETGLLNQPKCEKVREDSQCEIVMCSNERMALLRCENIARMPSHSQSHDGPNPNCEKPGRFEMLI